MRPTHSRATNTTRELRGCLKRGKRSQPKRSVGFRTVLGRVRHFLIDPTEREKCVPKFSPQEKVAMREELAKYKKREMEVHPEEKVNTAIPGEGNSAARHWLRKFKVEAGNKELAEFLHEQWLQSEAPEELDVAFAEDEDQEPTSDEEEVYEELDTAFVEEEE